MGKTSLLARGLQQASDAGARIVLTDFQMLNASQLHSVETLFQTLAHWIALQLEVDTLPGDVWNPGCGPSINFELYLRRQVLSQLTAPLVWGLDEADRLFPYEFASEVFALFRSWHNRRSLDRTGPWGRLTLVITYATEAHLFITDLNQSPFNIGTRVTLEDFTREQVADLNQRYGGALRNDAEVTRFFGWVGGQPYLSHRAIQVMAAQRLDLASFEAQSERETGIFGDHLRRLLFSLLQNPDLCEAVRQVLRGQPCPAAESFYRLHSAGVLTGESVRDARPRCQLYASYLTRYLL